MCGGMRGVDMIWRWLTTKQANGVQSQATSKVVYTVQGGGECQCKGQFRSGQYNRVWREGAWGHCSSVSPREGLKVLSDFLIQGGGFQVIFWIQLQNIQFGRSDEMLEISGCGAIHTKLPRLDDAVSADGEAGGPSHGGIDAITHQRTSLI